MNYNENKIKFSGLPKNDEIEIKAKEKEQNKFCFSNSHYSSYNANAKKFKAVRNSPKPSISWIPITICLEFLVILGSLFLVFKGYTENNFLFRILGVLSMDVPTACFLIFYLSKIIPANRKRPNEINEGSLLLGYKDIYHHKISNVIIIGDILFFIVFFITYSIGGMRTAGSWGNNSISIALFCITDIAFFFGFGILFTIVTFTSFICDGYPTYKSN